MLGVPQKKVAQKINGCAWLKEKWKIVLDNGKKTTRTALEREALQESEIAEHDNNQLKKGLRLLGMKPEQVRKAAAQQGVYATSYRALCDLLSGGMVENAIRLNQIGEQVHKVIEKRSSENEDFVTTDNGRQSTELLITISNASRLLCETASKYAVQRKQLKPEEKNQSNRPRASFGRLERNPSLVINGPVQVNHGPKPPPSEPAEG